MKNAVRALLVGMISAALLALGVSVASASVAPAAAVTISPSMVAPPGDGGSALDCRSHTAESTPHSGKVVVPWSYCYDPTTSYHRAWHDYCTHSPDSWNSADFRGPCARHDMCLAAGHSHSYCDGPLLSNMKTNCHYAYSHWYQVVSKGKCYAVAYTYYVAIKIYTHL